MTIFRQCIVLIWLSPSYFFFQPLVDVMAPASLPEGYQFPAMANGATFRITVPKGGVTKGQLFTVPIDYNCLGRETEIARSVVVPQRQWRDNWYSILRFGFFHPSLWNSMFCLPSKYGCYTHAHTPLMEVDWKFC